MTSDHPTSQEIRDRLDYLRKEERRLADAINGEVLVCVFRCGFAHQNRDQFRLRTVRTDDGCFEYIICRNCAKVLKEKYEVTSAPYGSVLREGLKEITQEIKYWEGELNKATSREALLAHHERIVSGSPLLPRILDKIPEIPGEEVGGAMDGESAGGTVVPIPRRHQT